MLPTVPCHSVSPLGSASAQHPNNQPVPQRPVPAVTQLLACLVWAAAVHPGRKTPRRARAARGAGCLTRPCWEQE
jgi:hypothetical protein